MRRITNFDHLDRRQPSEVEVNSPADVDTLARQELQWGGVPLPFSKEDNAKFHRAMFGRSKQ